jgi:hypothetical protein
MKKNNGIDWEVFMDEDYYHMWAVRPMGDKDFNSPRLFHFALEENALQFKELAEQAFVAVPTNTDNKFNEPTVTIPLKEYEWLQKRDERLSALENGGVDNWSGYSDALDYLQAANNEAAEDLSDD